MATQTIRLFTKRPERGDCELDYTTIALGHVVAVEGRGDVEEDWTSISRRLEVRYMPPLIVSPVSVLLSTGQRLDGWLRPRDIRSFLGEDAR